MFQYTTENEEDEVIEPIEITQQLVPWQPQPQTQPQTQPLPVQSLAVVPCVQPPTIAQPLIVAQPPATPIQQQLSIPLNVQQPQTDTSSFPILPNTTMSFQHCQWCF